MFIQKPEFVGCILDEELLKYREEWSRGGQTKYQLVWENWDRNIIPSYRTSQDKTLSQHLFQVIGVLDRLICPEDRVSQLTDILDLNPVDFISSKENKDILLSELTFLLQVLSSHILTRWMKYLNRYTPSTYTTSTSGIKTEWIIFILYLSYYL